MASVSQNQAAYNETVGWFNTFIVNTRSQWQGTPKESLVTPLIMGWKAAASSLSLELTKALSERPAGGSDLDQKVVQFRVFSGSTAESIKSLIQTPAQRQQTVRRETADPGANVVGAGTATDTATDETGPSLEEQLATSQGGAGSGGFSPWLILAGVALGVVAISAARKRGGMNGLNDGSDCGCGG